MTKVSRRQVKRCEKEVKKNLTYLEMAKLSNIPPFTSDPASPVRQGIPLYWTVAPILGWR